MAKSTKERERKSTIGGFIPGEVESHFDVEDANDEQTGKREWVLTSKATGEPFTIAHAYGDALFWYELGIHAGQNQPRRGPVPQGQQDHGQGGQRTPPPK